MTASTSDRPICPRCAHYFITYDPRFPYGCRAMNFKSRSLPHAEVEGATGAACVAFAAKSVGRREDDGSSSGA